MKIDIPKSHKKRVVIVGGGFGGLALLNRLDGKKYQVVLIDKNNYHQFQPLLYQVASSGLEPGSITFPFRKLLIGKSCFYFRMTEVVLVDADKKVIKTKIGELNYDYLVLAGGTTTNYFGNSNIQAKGLPMKNVGEALKLKSCILSNMERALSVADEKERRALLNIVIVGGGATGVEIAGVLAEMKRFIVPRDYPELKDKLNVWLIEGTDRVLGNMSPGASYHAERSLRKMGIRLKMNSRVADYINDEVITDKGEKIPAKTLIWVSGVRAVRLDGFDERMYGKGGRLVVDEYNRLKGAEDLYVIGDQALLSDEKYPNGHPQVAQVAIQQGKVLAGNLNAMARKKKLTPFHYKHKGVMATIGRNKAVADIYGLHLHGVFAWLLWLLIHLRSILGVKNKIVVLVDWIWNYLKYDQSSRSIFYEPESEEADKK